jgi:hypothetical protein
VGAAEHGEKVFAEAVDIEARAGLGRFLLGPCPVRSIGDIIAGRICFARAGLR